MLIELARTSIGDVIRRLSIEHKSGDLQVRSGKLIKTAFFDHGRLVFAASNLKKDRLGEALLALGRITDEEFSRVSALMKGDRKRRFGEALVASGVMDKSEMGTAVARQVRRVVLSLFELSEGAASFEERRCTNGILRLAVAEDIDQRTRPAALEIASRAARIRGRDRRRHQHLGAGCVDGERESES